MIWDKVILMEVGKIGVVSSNQEKIKESNLKSDHRQPLVGT